MLGTKSKQMPLLAVHLYSATHASVIFNKVNISNKTWSKVIYSSSKKRTWIVELVGGGGDGGYL